MSVDLAELEDVGTRLLMALGEDPNREGLRDTPKRFARWWAEFIDHAPGLIDRTFTLDNADEMVVVSGVETWSLCEHHLLPFRATVAIGYIPEGKVLGLSKLARIAHAEAHRLQVQERLVQDIADRVASSARTSHVGVIADGEHLCMVMRGVRTNASMRTSVLRGAFKDKGPARAEFLSLVNGRKP